MPHTGNIPPLAKAWLDSGSFIKWTSTLPENKPFGELNIFTVQKGDPAKPVIVFVHGYPTSSFDFEELFSLLCADYFVCALDTPGYGLSDKPRPGFRYSIEDDARLIDHYIQNVLHAKSVTLVTHDKGDSVGLALLGLCQTPGPYEIQRHILLNGNVYLPLADLTSFQKLLLREKLGPLFTKAVTGRMIAKGLSRLTHTNPVPGGRTDAVAYMIGCNGGAKVQHDVIQYLNQRRQNELRWLETLKNSGTPVSLIWGADDPIATLKVPDYLWENWLKGRAAPSEYWRVPKANHYLQNDCPEVLNRLIRMLCGETQNLLGLDPAERPQKVGG